MPVAVQTQTLSHPHQVSLMALKPVGAAASAFTAVNGQTSPSFATKPSNQDGARPDYFFAPKSYSQPSPPPPRPESQAQKPVLMTNLNTLPRMRENSRETISPRAADPRGASPTSPPKRKYSESGIAGIEGHSPDRAPGPVGPSSSYTSDSSPRDAFGSGPMLLPPINVKQRPDHEQPWPARETQTNILPSPQSRTPQEPTSSLSGLPHMGQSTSDRRAGLQRTSAGVLVNPEKKRKRQFANRTKTGCGTCRRRKKKCDELKPECENCRRGAFVCEGYALKSQYGKAGSVKAQPPLQSKVPFTVDPPQLFHSHGTVHDSAPNPAPSDSNRTLPTNVDHIDRPSSNTAWSGWGERPRVHEYQQSRPPASHPTETLLHPLHQPHPPQHPNAFPPSAPRNLPDTNHDPPMHRHVPPQPPVHQSAPQGPAMGLPAPPPHYASAPPRPREKSEKEKMLAGEPFCPYHYILVTEREHCSKAVWRFNMIDNDQLNITAEERYRIFQSILFARWLPRTSQDYSQQPIGRVGAETYVENPFHCDYGYNIDIEDMVVIGRGCKFLDSGKIRIGKRSHIGANVTIDTQKMPTDSKSDKGSRGVVVAAEVYIGENVCIGTGSIIMAGVKIGSNAIIHPGSVVMKDVPRDCVARGNPANVSTVFWDE